MTTNDRDDEATIVTLAYQLFEAKTEIVVLREALTALLAATEAMWPHVRLGMHSKRLGEQYHAARAAAAAVVERPDVH